MAGSTQKIMKTVILKDQPLIATDGFSKVCNICYNCCDNIELLCPNCEGYNFSIAFRTSDVEKVEPWVSEKNLCI